MHIILFLLLLTGCEKKEEETPRPTAYVEVAKAKAEKMPYQISTIGNTQAYATVDIRPQVSGELTGYYFKDGALVKKGDLLFTIDERPYQAQLEEAKGQYTQAKASLVYNESKVERYKGLLPEDYVSILNYQEYVSDALIAAGKVEQYDGAIKNAEVNLGYCTLNSPINGLLGRHLFDPGNIVTPDEKTPLVTIKQIQPIYSYFTIAERFFPELQKYNQQGLPVEMHIVGDEKTTHHGWLDFVNNTVDSKSGTITLRAIFENKKLNIWPGQFAQVNIILYEIPGAVVIPQTAVSIDTKGPYIYIAKSDKTVEQRRVKLGQVIGDQQIIEEGVKAGETVVTKGQIGLSQGAKYEVKNGS